MPPTPQELFLLAVVNMEQALGDAVRVANGVGDLAAIERILRLVIKKEIVLELLAEELGETETPGV
ncbi:hypothetical protein P9148_17455 [Bacillus siamensis]|uniref:hypothetical protein n=1 Tax=Bacillus siamensis TaxID=659243 RepID=UPI002DBD344B|nr:hypothetical protein [Bacillus siamensis]MEC3656847.1 hypothetical protein [Bacillus siamensis]